MKRWLCYSGGLLCGLVVLFPLLVVMGVKLNIGDSLQATLLRCRPVLPEQPLQRGEIVRFYASRAVQEALPPTVPPEVRGLPWLKRVAALPGDTVCWEPDSLLINGQRAGGLPLYDIYGLPTRHGCQRLTAEEVLVLGTHPRSYDGRYSGPMPRREVIDRCDTIF